MSTSEFVNRIDSNDLLYIIARFFDEIMVLYNLVGNRYNMSISTNGNESSIVFVLSMNSEEEAVDLFNSINNTSFSIYNDTFIIRMSLSGRIINTSINKTISC